MKEAGEDEEVQERQRVAQGQTGPGNLAQGSAVEAVDAVKPIGQPCRENDFPQNGFSTDVVEVIKRLVDGLTSRLMD